MPTEPRPIIDYHTPRPKPRALFEFSRWQFCIVLCFLGALYFGASALAIHEGSRSPTEPFKQYLIAVAAQRITQPDATPPPFVGTHFQARSYFTLPSTYLAIGLTASGVVLIIVKQRQARQRGVDFRHTV